MCLEDIRQHGAANITHLINRLRGKGVLISDSTLRNIVRDIFRVESKKGRKPGLSK